MQILVNTADKLMGSTELTRRVNDTVSDALDRFGAQVTRVEVHFGDENSDKPGENDKRCVIEAHLAGHPPNTVRHLASSVEEALNGAVHKLERTIGTTLDRAKDHNDRSSIRKGGTED
ncbi:MAG: putative ribosomal subunit interface protein [Herminiimonas sp.]|nr:putative ribosomal subunit interface protein [Herminiimonas sp.]